MGGLRLITTWPCIVEASYLLQIPQHFEMLKWIELGGAVVYPVEPANLGDIARWMRRINERGKREMDLADATELGYLGKCRQRRSFGLPFVGYLPTPICFISVALSQNRYSSAITPCLLQCPRVAIGRW